MITQFKIYEQSSYSTKIFENINKPKIGDYVVCRDLSESKPINDFVKNNVGKITHILYITGNRNPEDNVKYQVKYKNVPDYLKPQFEEEKEYDEDENKKQIVQLKNRRRMIKEEILFFSPNKEDCELFIKSKKFNL